MNRCQKFGEKNIITDEIQYDFVSTCRKDEEKCGLEGKAFEAESNVEIKQFIHILQYHAPSFYLGFLIVSYFGFSMIILK